MLPLLMILNLNLLTLNINSSNQFFIITRIYISYSHNIIIKLINKVSKSIAMLYERRSMEVIKQV